MATRDTAARLIADVYAGKLHPRIAAGLAPLMHLQPRVLQIPSAGVEETPVGRR